MDLNKLKAIIVAVMAAFAALYLGIAAATAQMEVVFWTLGGVTLVVCLALGRRIWLILPLLTALGLSLPLPGTLSTLMMAQGLILGFSMALFLMRKLPMKLRITELEFWCLLFCLCVVQAYMRNPVGLSLFGGSMVGGRAYVEFAATFLTAGLLSTLLVAPNDLRWWVRLTLIGSIANFVIGIIGILVPGVGYFLVASFSTDVQNNETKDSDAAGRVAFVRGISRDLAIWISSRMSPLRACLHPVWAPLVLFTLGAAAYSGYRSQFAVVGLSYFVGLCYRGGFPHVIISSVIVALCLVLLSFVNLIAPLPPNMQRALTILPGTWEQQYKNDAEGSTNWRVELWIEALTSDRYIRNKSFGDGLGFSTEQLQRSLSLAENRGSGISGFDHHRESILISGDYHSGPVQTIRTVGYFGLAVVLLGLIRVAFHAHRQILRCRGTEWYSTALFIGIPIIWGPFFWLFIFGSFTGGFTMLFMGTALVRLMEQNLPLPAYVTARARPYLLKPAHLRQGTPSQPAS